MDVYEQRHCIGQKRRHGSTSPASRFAAVIGQQSLLRAVSSSPPPFREILLVPGYSGRPVSVRFKCNSASESDPVTCFAQGYRLTMVGDLHPLI